MSPYMPRAGVIQPDLTVFRAADHTRVVAGAGIGANGSDSNDGLSLLRPMATIAAAYAALPASGGTLMLLNGTHNVGAGFTGSHIKPAVFTSIVGTPPGTGHFPSYNNQGASTDQMPTIVGTGATLITIAADTNSIGRGWGFYGICFDMRTSPNLTGIHSNGHNFLFVKDCIAEGRGVSDNFLIRTNYTAATDSDSSWHRFEDNKCRVINLCSLAHGETDGNSNNNQIMNNVIFGPGAEGAIVLNQTQRSMVIGNNVEGGRAVRYKGSSHYNYTFFNGGEAGSSVPYLTYESPSYSNIHWNYGAIGGGSDSSPVVQDDCIADAGLGAFGNHAFITSYVSYLDQTTDYTLPGGTQWANYMFNMNKATAITFSIDQNSTRSAGVGSTFSVRQGGAGQVTIAPLGATTISTHTPISGASTPPNLKTRAQGSVLNFQKVGTDAWIMWGDNAG